MEGVTRGEFSTREVARVVGIPATRVRAMARAGYCRPQHDGRRLRFAFQDIVLLRAALGLLKARVPTRRVRRALSELRRQLPADRPVSSVRIVADGRRVVVRDGKRAWHPDTGQSVFVWDVANADRFDAIVVPPRRASRKREIKPDPRASAMNWFEYALSLEEEDPPEACAAYRRAIELDPNLGDAYVNLGRLEHERGNLAEALKAYRAALDRMTNDPVAHYNIALALEDRGELRRAVRHYQRALELSPEFADAHFNLGRLLDQMGRRAEALRHYLAYRRLTGSK